MIFVTTGTDHHPFDRLVKEMDRLKGKGLIHDEVFIQSGSSRHKPEFCRYEEYLSFDQMMQRIKEAKIIITHGGPGSIMPVIYAGKVPMVVPRRKKLGEAVDDHQTNFAKKLEGMGQVIRIDKIDEMEYKIKTYEETVLRLKQTEKRVDDPVERVSRFTKALESICNALMEKKAKK